MGGDRAPAMGGGGGSGAMGPNNSGEGGGGGGSAAASSIAVPARAKISEEEPPHSVTPEVRQPTLSLTFVLRRVRRPGGRRATRSRPAGASRCFSCADCAAAPLIRAQGTEPGVHQMTTSSGSGGSTSNASNEARPLAA